jgi:HSP20 family protein
MKNPFRNLAELQRDLGNIAVEITQVKLVHFTTPKSWQPAINAFRCGNAFTICVELAGVDRDALEVRAEPRRLVIRGHRAAPEPACDDPAMQVLALEIDHGRFERVLELPAEVEPDRVAAEHRNGLLWIRLPLRTHA